MICKKCGSQMSKNGTTVKSGRKIQKYVCGKCGFNASEGIDPPVVAGKSLGLSEDQFRNKFDLRFIVELKCGELQKGVFLSMSEFVKFCSITPGSGYKDVLFDGKFDKYHGKVRGEVYWSHPDSILKMKNEGILN